jgi:hypothetical protein
MEIEVPDPVAALRVGIGTPDEPFAPAWRFWTSGDSAYVAVRVLGQTFKASFHPATEEHPKAVWRHGFTRESGGFIKEKGSRLSHTWELPPELDDTPGWYQGPGISIPRLRDRKYDLPPTLGLSRIQQWVPAPEPGEARFLTVFLSDAREDLPPFRVADAEGDFPVGILPMRNGWHMTVMSARRPIKERELPPLKKLLSEKFGLTREAQPGSESAGMVWVTTSPDGPPLFVQLVLDSDNFYEEHTE